MITNNTKTRKRRGEGSISLHSTGRYIGRITITGYPQYTCYGDDEKVVQKQLDEYKNKVIRNEAIAKKVFLKDYVESWLINYKKTSLRPSSYDRKESTFRNHIENSSIGRYQLGNITATDIQKLINTKAESLSYSSIKKIYELLDECFRNAVVIRDIPFNPMDGVRLPNRSSLPVKTKEISILSVKDIEKIKKAAKTTYSNGAIRFRYAPAYILLLNTGIRSGEALALTWDCIDWKKKTVTIRKSVSRVKDRSENPKTRTHSIIGDVKTSKGKRVIPLNKTAQTALKELLAYQKEHHIITDYVIATQNGNMVLHGSFQRLFNNILNYAGVNHVGLHALRHTCATNLVNNGVNIKIVSALLGHSSVTITYNTYVHPDLKSTASAVELLDN